MHRLSATLTVIAAVLVFAVAGYVIGHHDPVARAGQTPGYTALPSTTPAPPSSSASPDGTGKTTPTVAFLGDDYTTGTGASANAARFTTLVCKRLGVTEQNFGADGAGYASPSAAGAYTPRVAQVVAAKPDVVVVSGGRNDVLDHADTVAAHATTLFTTLHAELPNAVLVAVAPFWGDSAPQAALAKIADSIRRAVEAAGGTYLDIADPPTRAPGVDGRRRRPQRRGLRRDRHSPRAEAPAADARVVDRVRVALRVAERIASKAVCFSRDVGVSYVAKFTR